MVACFAGRTALPAAAIALLVGPLSAATTAEVAEVTVYFGCGCFWHMQHEFVELEMAPPLNRREQAVTARTAYAGSKQVGPDGLVCYHNSQGVADYGQLGYSEVVSLSIPEDRFDSFAQKFWQACPGGRRRDVQDVGGEYRSVVGLPGGMNSPLMPALRRYAGSTTLVAGHGGDPDTLGTGQVFVYDTAQFPAHIAEKYHQFHNDMVDNYGPAYNALRQLAKATSCPGDKGGIMQFLGW